MIRFGALLAGGIAAGILLAAGGRGAKETAAQEEPADRFSSELAEELTGVCDELKGMGRELKKELSQAGDILQDGMKDAARELHDTIRELRHERKR